MTLIIHGINIGPFLKAQARFEQFRQHLQSDQEKAGAIQAFEFCYELAWKTMKRLLEKKGVEVRSPRDCFREAALTGMIADPKPWFVFLEKRNITVHTYEEAAVLEIISIFDQFSHELAQFIEHIQHDHS